MSDLIQRTHVGKSRRQHHCVWCVEPINVGEASIRYIGFIDDISFCDYWHEECDKAASEAEDAMFETFVRHSQERPKPLKG